MNYLINESPLLVLPTLACMLGLNEAIITQQIHYWLGISKHEIDGKKWVFNTYQDWQKQFPWWSLDTVKRTFRNLEKLGVLETDNYNKMNIDRTKWYTINYQRLEEIFDQGKMPSWTGQNALMDGGKMHPPITIYYQIIHQIFLQIEIRHLAVTWLKRSSTTLMRFGATYILKATNSPKVAEVRLKQDLKPSL